MRSANNAIGLFLGPLSKGGSSSSLFFGPLLLKLSQPATELCLLLPGPGRSRTLLTSLLQHPVGLHLPLCLHIRNCFLLPLDKGLLVLELLLSALCSSRQSTLRRCGHTLIYLRLLSRAAQRQGTPTRNHYTLANVMFPWKHRSSTTGLHELSATDLDHQSPKISHVDYVWHGHAQPVASTEEGGGGGDGGG
jgi:hypothetical protein